MGNNFELLKTLLELNKLTIEKLPQASFAAYTDLLKLISKKEIAVPADIDLWNQIWDLLKDGFNTSSIYKTVRDELLHYNHPTIELSELLFFERGLFKYGKMDEDQDIADDILRRVLSPLASSESKYTDVLKRNAKIIGKIIEIANNSIVEFRSALDVKCSEIFDDIEIKQFSDVLIQKSDNLLNGSSPEDTTQTEGS